MSLLVGRQTSKATLLPQHEIGQLTYAVEYKMTKQIPLTQGKFAIVDDADYDFLMQWKWHYRKDGTIGGHAARKDHKNKPMTVYMHNQLIKCKDGFLPDHKDGNGLNNQRHNLRSVTHSQNSCNKKKRRQKTSSQYKGVHLCKRTLRWLTRIKIKSKQISGGSHVREVDAAIAYNELSKKYHGQYGSLNVITEQETML